MRARAVHCTPEGEEISDAGHSYPFSMDHLSLTDIIHMKSLLFETNQVAGPLEYNINGHRYRFYVIPTMCWSY